MGSVTGNTGMSLRQAVGEPVEPQRPMGSIAGRPGVRGELGDILSFRSWARLSVSQNMAGRGAIDIIISTIAGLTLL